METTLNGAGVRAARREEWRRILADLDASGERASAYGRVHGIPAWKFSYWRKALSPHGPAEQAGFVQMRVRSGRSPTTLWVEAGNWRVAVEPGFDAATLRQVVEALGS